MKFVIPRLTRNLLVFQGIAGQARNEKKPMTVRHCE